MALSANCSCVFPNRFVSFSSGPVVALHLRFKFPDAFHYHTMFISDDQLLIVFSVSSVSAPGRVCRDK